MSFGQSKRRSITCPKCKSFSWQAIEVAYQQASRVSERGYESISCFGQSISPPRERSTFGAPLFTAIGLGSTAIVFLPGILEECFGLILAEYRINDRRVYIPALAIAAVGFFAHLVNNLRYNAEEWAAAYSEWRRHKVCRKCGHKFSSNESVSRTLP